MTLRVAFFASDKPRERLLADAFLSGMRAHGHDGFVIPLGQPVPLEGYELACMVGVKSRALFDAHHRAGIHTIYLDKGYARHRGPGPVAGWEFWRVSIDAHHPTRFLAEQRSPSDRFERLGLEPAAWRTIGETVLIAGSSAKYHEFYGLKDPTQWTKDLVRDLRGETDRKLIYRPKPSWKEAVPVKKAGFSRPPTSLAAELDRAHVLITHGSNACFEAILAGVPCIVLGDAVARPISSTSLSEVEAPRIPSDEERLQWLANLAYWQFTSAEFASGEAWASIGGRIHA